VSGPGEDPGVYRKHDSFVAIRRRPAGPDDLVLARVERLVREGDASALGPEARPLLPRIRAELGGAFKLGTYEIEELRRIPDAQVLRYLAYRYRYDVFPARRELDRFPPCLQVEPTSICNYRCVFCYQTDAELTRKANGHMGSMPLELFREIVDQAEGRCEAITLASRGDPLICKDLKAMLAYCRGKFLGLKVNTNAWFLDEAMSHAILEAGVSTLVFSADAAAEPLYSQLRVGGSLDRVLANVRLFHEVRERHYPASTTITRVSGVKMREEQDLDAMEAFWGALVDQVAFVTYNPWENTYERPPSGVETPCSDLWRRMFVWWDGRVNPCDVDYRSTLSVANARGAKLEAIWRGEGYERLRAAHVEKRRGATFPCNRCTVV
jgi:MoaA/NifB/PqqE/SkfB family radical SAM enzyme